MADRDREQEAEETQELKSQEDDSEIKVEVKGLDTKMDDIEEPEEDDTVEGESTTETEEPQQPESSDLEDKLRESEDRYLRLAAEYENFRKRTARQFSSISESAIEDFAIELLNILDNFQRALEVDTEKTATESLKKGVELIFGQFTDLLKKKGVEPFDSVGERFDPNLHEAMMTVQSDEHEDGVVVSEFSKGYKLKDKVLRHAKVSVSQGKD